MIATRAAFSVQLLGTLSQVSLHCLQLDDQLLPSSPRIHQDSLTANTYSQYLWYIDIPYLQYLQVFSTGQTPTTDIRNDWGPRGNAPGGVEGQRPLGVLGQCPRRAPCSDTGRG